MKRPLGFQHTLRIYICLFVTVFIFTLSVGCSKPSDNDSALVVALLSMQSQSSAGSKMFAIAAVKADVGGGLSGLDSQCNSDSNKPSGGGTYKALVVDGTNRVACTSANCATSGASEHVDWVLKANKKYVQSDGTTVIGTTTSNGIFTFPLSNPFQSTFSGTNLTVTGMFADWTSSGNNCSGWSTASSSSANFADHTATSTDAIYAGGSIGCSSSAMKIVCVEQ
ncbi:PF07588 family protein [Leptospira licerasiae serovar Varillal str. VAR 010]|uniref:PF07588 family protein n=2 Tax=Leptospira licerasiae TaxID=447106 RepID=A0ABN0H757_9LEPT|nr:PF07588 family protein [Leptospira licerasiae serovar Varillal str. VAR 010]EJZ41479.1 PF07588 family protein [Leptospira licerasiae str. MMD4847]